MLSALLMLALAAVASGCGSTSNGLPVSAGDAARPMPDSITAYGFYHVPGQLIVGTRMDSTERFATVAGQKMGLFGVQGVRFRASVKGSGKETTTAVEVGYGGTLVNTTMTSCDSMICPAGGHWVVATMNVPFTYNEGDGVVAAITSNPGYTVVVPVSTKSTNGAVYVPIRALEAVLKKVYGPKAGTYEGTAYFLSCKPRVSLNAVENRSPSRRWTVDPPPSMRSANADGTLVFDVEVVVAEGYVPPGLKTATLRPVEEVLPK